MDNPLAWRPSAINTGNWLTGYSLNELLERANTDRIVLPICSLGTPFDDLVEQAPLVLPPLYHEALDDGLREAKSWSDEHLPFEISHLRYLLLGGLLVGGVWLNARIGRRSTR